MCKFHTQHLCASKMCIWVACNWWKCWHPYRWIIKATNGTDEFSSGYYMWPLSTVGYSISDISSSWYSSSRAAELTGFYYKRQSSTYKYQQTAASCCSGEARTANFQSSSVSINELSSGDWARRWMWTNNKAFEEITCHSSNYFSITLW